MAPETAFAAPETAFPGPETAFAAPETAFPGPETAFAGPVTAFAGPVTAFAGPVTAFAGPVTAFAGPVTAFAGPETAFAGPVTAFAGPVTAFAGPVTAFAGPVTAFPGPVTAFAGPVTAFARPVTAFAGPVTAFAGPVTAFAGPVTAFARPVTAFAGPVHRGSPSRAAAFRSLERSDGSPLRRPRGRAILHRSRRLPMSTVRSLSAGVALAAALGLSGAAFAAASAPDLELTPPSLRWSHAPSPALDFAGDGQGGGAYVIVGRAEPGLSAIEFVVDTLWRLGVETLAWDAYFVDPGGAVALVLLAPIADALIVWGIGSFSDWFAPRLGWTLLGAYGGSLLGGVLFWGIFVAGAGSLGALVLGGIVAALVGAAVTVAVQNGTKWRRRPLFRRFWAPPPPPPPYYEPVAEASGAAVRAVRELPSVSSPVLAFAF